MQVAEKVHKLSHEERHSKYENSHIVRHLKCIVPEWLLIVWMEQEVAYPHTEEHPTKPYYFKIPQLTYHTTLISQIKLLRDLVGLLNLCTKRHSSSLLIK